MKKIISYIIIAAVLAGSVLSLGSCDKKPEIYKLAEMILNNKQDGSYYTFGAEFNIKINKDYLYKTGLAEDFKNAELEVIPGELKLKLDGKIYHMEGLSSCQAAINLSMGEYKLTMVCHNDGVLYFENNEMTRIIADLLTAAGFIDFPVKKLFDEIAETGKIFSVNLKDIDLSWFEQYAAHIDRAFKIESKIDMREEDYFPFLKNPDFKADIILRFDKIITQVRSGLVKIDGYKYAELSIVLNPEDNMINILATRENGRSEVLPPVKSDIGIAAAIAKIKKEPKAFWTENMIPMRYILELLGEEVSWDNSAKKPCIIRGYDIINFKAAIVNSRSYINLEQLLAQYDIEENGIGDYLEFKISRK